MKIYTRSGRSFKITEELYKKLKSVKLFEEGDLTSNPQSGAAPQQTPQQLGQQSQSNPQQNHQQQNNGDIEQLDYRIETNLINRLQKDGIDITKDEVKSEVKLMVSHMSFDEKSKFIKDKKYNQGIYNELFQTIHKITNTDSNNNFGKIYDTIFEIIKKIYYQVDTVLNDFNKDVTDEINNKLNKKYETIDVNKFIMSGLPKIDELVNKLKPEILKLYKNKKLKEAAEQKKLVDVNGNELKKFNDETNDFITDENVYNKIEKYIKDSIYDIIVSKLNDGRFKKNTLKQSSELGEEWVNNIIEKLINVVKYGIYGDTSTEQSNYGAIDIHNYSESQANEIWDKLKDKVNSIQPSNELDEMFKIAILKMIDLVDEYDNSNTENKKDNKDNENKKDNKKLEDSENEKAKVLVFRIYNDYSKILNVAKNFSSTRKINKNFVLDIINDSKTMNNIKRGIEYINNSVDDKKITQVTDFIYSEILEKYVFKNSLTSDADYDVNKYTTENGKEVKEVVSLNKKYNAIILTEKKKKELPNKDQIQNVSLLLDFLKKYEMIIYNKFKLFYNNIDKIDKSIDITKQIQRIYNRIMNLDPSSSDNDVDGFIPMMIFGIVKKVVVVASNFAVNNIDNYIDEKIKKDEKQTNDPEVLKERAIDKFEMYMGRKPLQEDIQLYKETLEKLKNHISQMKDVDEMFIKSAAKRYFYKVTDYFIKTNSKRKNLDSDLISAITSLKRGKGNESEEFLNRCMAYSELGNYYTESNKVNGNNDYFDTLLSKIFDNNEVINNQMINSLFHEVWITNNNLSSAQLITIMTKNPALKEKYEFNQDYDVTALYSKKPIVILDKSSNEFIGVLSFISIHNLINALKQLGNFDITKLTPQFKGRKYT